MALKSGTPMLDPKTLVLDYSKFVLKTQVPRYSILDDGITSQMVGLSYFKGTFLEF
jgi:hypothetical protein